MFSPIRESSSRSFGRRYTVLAGTNRWNEWFATWPALLAPSANHEAVDIFEVAAANATGCRHAVAFGAGRMALYALLEAMGFEKGDEIVVPGFTCTVVPNAMIYRGLRPIYADIESVTFNVDPEAVESAITPRTRAIYMQHTFGVSCDVERLQAIARRRGLIVIEDAAHSLGAKCGDRLHGEIGDVAFFSTDRTKVINTHLGGCAVTNDDGIAMRLREIQGRAVAPGGLLARRMVASFLAEYFLRDPVLFQLGRPILGLLRRLGILYTWLDEAWTAIPNEYPYPCKMTSPLAEIGTSQLSDLAQNLKHRREVAHWLEARIGWYGGVLADQFDSQAWLRYSLLVRDPAEFSARLEKHVELGLWFTHNIFGRKDDPEAVGYTRGSCPIAENVCRHIVNFPTHARIPVTFFETVWEQHGNWLMDQVVRPVSGRIG